MRVILFLQFVVLALISSEQYNCSFKFKNNIRINCNYLSCELRDYSLPKQRPTVTLRIFGMREKNALSEKLQSAYRLHVKIQEEEKAKELEKKKALSLKEETERRMIFNKFLGWPHSGSSFLKDFHPNRI